MKSQENVFSNQIILYLFLLSAIVIAFVIFIFWSGNYSFQYAFADSYRHIAIEFSDTCLTLQDLGDYETCSSPEMVQAMFPPSSLKIAYKTMFENAEQTDALPYQQNDIIKNHQLSCIKEDYCNVFDIQKGTSTIYWYNPDLKSRDYLDSIITINSNLLHKNLNTPEDIIQDNGTNRKIDFDANQINIKNCKKVTFDPFNIGIELGYLIWYLHDNCRDIEKLGYLSEPYVYDLTKTQIGDLKNSYDWLWLYNQTAIKEKYKGYMIGKDP